MKPSFALAIRSAVLLLVSLTCLTSCASKQKNEPPATTSTEDRALRANDALAAEAKRQEGFWSRIEKSWDKRF